MEHEIGWRQRFACNCRQMGGALFVAARLSGASIGGITRHLWPLMAATFIVVLLVSYIPSLSLWLPRLIASF